MSIKYLCESGKIHLRPFLKTGGGDLGRPFAKCAKQSYSLGASLGERGDVVDHLARLNSNFHHHAFFLANKGKCDDAESLSKRALAIREETLGPHHPGVASSLNNLARVLKSQVRCY